MGTKIEHLTFDEWLIYVFDHPVPQGQESEWYWDMEKDWWDEMANPTLTVEFLTRLFESATFLLEPYSDAQVNQGLWYLASNACSSHMFALMEERVPWPARRRCIASIHQLYEQCFVTRCSPHLSHIDEPGANPLNSVCYMWWDIIPLYGKPDDPAQKDLGEAVLQVMESTLQLDSIPCRESALHGLGHWQHAYPERVGEIIDKFSMTNPVLPDKLREYMMNAYVGYVL